MDIVTLALAKKYVDDTAKGLGAVKGANATIERITPVEGGSDVVFAWIGIDGTKQTQTLFVANGKDGETPKLKTINGQSIVGDGDIVIEGGQSGGLTSIAKMLLLTILENAAYVTDQSNNLSLLKDVFDKTQSDDTSGDIPDEGDSDESGSDVEQHGSTLEIRSVSTFMQNGSVLFLT